MNKQQVPQAQIDLTTTTPVISPEGNSVFQEGVILRKVSSFYRDWETDRKSVV